MSKQGKSRYSGFGKTTHYDSKGSKVGYSHSAGFGKTNHYDSRGNKTGYSHDAGFGKVVHYDNNGKRVGTTYGMGTGSQKHYDKSGKQVGYSYGNKYSTNHYNGSDGCYIATCVYGSYDCPEVWLLRRFRDYCLAESCIGRCFIKFYYKTSPTLVKYYGELIWFKKIGKYILDKLICILSNKGYSNTPYKDKNY